MKDQCRDRGVSLLELTAVLAIFSLVAVMSLQLLSAALENRSRVKLADAELADIVAVSAVLRRDVEMSAPVRPLSGDRSVFRVRDGGQTVEFATASRAADLSASVSLLDEVSWRFDQTSSTLTRARRRSGTSDEFQNTLTLTDVTEWQLRVTNGSGQWTSAQSWRGANDYDLPAAVEVQFSSKNLGNIRIVTAR